MNNLTTVFDAPKFTHINATMHPDLPKAAQPKCGRPFDPWNSVALGHQRAETRGPGGWRENRTWKLHSQLRAGNSGGQRLDNAVGGGGGPRADDLRRGAARSVVDMLRKPGTMETGGGSGSGSGDGGASREQQQQNHAQANKDASNTPKIFDGLVIYVNGSTHPRISDHKLKHVLVENGARMSIHLGRRQVSHVILGQPSGPKGGAGGGLAGGKLEKEIRRVSGCGVKYVSVEWVLESLKAGRRLPEARFGNLKVAPKGQSSVYGAFSSPSLSSSSSKK